MSNSESNDKKNQSQYEPFWLQGRVFVYDPIRKVYKAEPKRKYYQGKEEGYRVSPLIPVGVSVKRDWFLFITSFLIGLGTFIVVAKYTFYAGGQWSEMIKATNAATENAAISAQALRDNELSFIQTMQQMQQQTLAQQKSAIAQMNAAESSLAAAGITERQFELSLQQAAQAERLASARLVFQNVETRLPKSGDIYHEKTIISFDLVNLGSSVASEIAETGNDDGRYYHEKSRAENLAETITDIHIDPAGGDLSKDQKPRHVQIESDWPNVRQHGSEWMGWKRFTYVNIFGKIKSVCILFVGSKHGVSRSLCLSSPQFDQ